MSAYRTCILPLTLAICGAVLGFPAGAVAQTTGSTGVIKGQVTDSTGAAIPGADVLVTSGKTFSKKFSTDETGTFTAPALAPGSYSVAITKFGFANFSTKPFAVGAGKTQTLTIPLELQASKQEVTVASDAVGTVSTDPANNAGQLVLKDTDLDALPDDPDDLAADLQALAGPSAGPNGGQIYIDGFTGGNLPPKSSIREIRINQNPFSAEYDRLGFGRIEILTKPGTDRYRGSISFNDSDNVFNSRNPYLVNSGLLPTSSTALNPGTTGATNTNPTFQSRYYGGNFGGPIGKKKASFFADFQRREIDDNGIVNATLVDPKSFTTYLYSQAVPTPNRNTEGSLRLDYQLNTNNTLVARYSFQEARQNNSGIGTFSLPSTGYTTVSPEHRLQLTETMVLGAKVVNETRFQFLNERSTQDGPNGLASLVVAQAFQGGGAQVGRSWDTQRHYEVQNYTSVAQGTHAFKFGVRLRSISDDNNSQSNFGGTFTFSGGFGPTLDANNQPIAGTNVPLTSIETYRRNLLFSSLGVPQTACGTYGSCPYQFSITTGQPYLHITSVDTGLFALDDWRLRPNLTVSYGLRYEFQNYLSDHSNVAPRIGVAWSPFAGKSGRARTVIRAGAGIFYDRFQEGSILNSERFNGTNQVRYLVTNPTFYPNIPSVAQLQTLAAQQSSTSSSGNTVTRYVVDPNLHAPTTIQSSLSVERQLPWNTTLSVNYLNSHVYHYFRTVNINTPLPGTYNPADPSSGAYPYGYKAGGIYEYQSTGALNQRQIVTSVTTRVNSNISLTGFYIFAQSHSNSDGLNSFPGNPYDLRGEYGDSSIDVRHRFTMFGSILTKYGIRLSPTIFAQTGTPFNITTGQDYNGDLQLTDRPSFADPSLCGQKLSNIACTPFGDFNLKPGPNDKLIPRNYGRNPGSFAFNMRLSKVWGFGETRTGPRGNGGGGGGQGGPGGGGPRGMMGGGGPGGGGGGGPRGGGGGMGGGGGDTTNHRYNLALTVEARNLLNHTNPGAYSGNLLSPYFGISNSLGNAGGPPGGQSNNRRLTLGMRFSF